MLMARPSTYEKFESCHILKAEGKLKKNIIGIFKLQQGASIGSFCWMVGRLVGWLVCWLLEKSVETDCGNMQNEDD